MRERRVTGILYQLVCVLGYRSFGMEFVVLRFGIDDDVFAL